MLIIRVLSALLVALTSVDCALLDPRQSLPPDGSVNIGRVTTSGSGCLQGSVPFNVYPNQTVVLQRLSNFHVSIGPNIPGADKAKNCAIHIDISYPAGWQFLLVQSSYSGFARLDRGIAGNFHAQYFLSSNPGNSFITRADTAGEGFLTGTEFTLDQSSINSPDIWSKCSGSDIAHFSNRIAVENSTSTDPNASGELWANGSPTQTISTLWRRC